MLTLLVGIIVEILVATLFAGLILAIAVPMLNRGGLITARDATSTAIIVGVMVGALALALFRPGSAIRRYVKR
jgi:hypothetical protein